MVTKNGKKPVLRPEVIDANFTKGELAPAPKKEQLPAQVTEDVQNMISVVTELANTGVQSLTEAIGPVHGSDDIRTHVKREITIKFFESK